MLKHEGACREVACCRASGPVVAERVQVATAPTALGRERERERQVWVGSARIFLEEGLNRVSASTSLLGTVTFSPAAA